jgi:hypothetical protein
LAVLAGMSGSLLDHPREFMESRNVEEAILLDQARSQRRAFHFFPAEFSRTVNVTLNRYGYRILLPLLEIVDRLGF